METPHQPYHQTNKKSASPFGPPHDTKPIHHTCRPKRLHPNLQAKPTQVYAPSVFFPLFEILIQAIQRTHLEGIPYTHTDLVQKYLALSPATSKGRMKRPQAGICSTCNSKTSQSRPIQDDECPPEQADAPHIISNDGQANNIFCFASLADKQAGSRVLILCEQEELKGDAGAV